MVPSPLPRLRVFDMMLSFREGPANSLGRSRRAQSRAAGKVSCPEYRLGVKCRFHAPPACRALPLLSIQRSTTQAKKPTEPASGLLDGVINSLESILRFSLREEKETESQKPRFAGLLLPEIGFPPPSELRNPKNRIFPLKPLVPNEFSNSVF